MNEYSTVEVCDLLRKAVDKYGSQAKVARLIGVSRQHLNDVLSGNRGPNGKIAQWLKLKRVVIFRSLNGKPQ